ncbi:MAG TPA: methyltransferase domain-containing protein, partial [Polyangiaceae bacterium]
MMPSAALTTTRAASLLPARAETSMADMAIEARFYDWQRAHGQGGRRARGHFELYDAMARELGGTVLELGCGTARVAADLAVRGREVVALDANPHALRAAQQHL